MTLQCKTATHAQFDQSEVATWQSEENPKHSNYTEFKTGKLMGTIIESWGTIWKRLWRLLAFRILESMSIKESFSDGRGLSTDKKLVEVGR